MKRLRAPKDTGQGLNRDPGNIVHRLLGSERYARSLGMEAHEPRALVLCAKAVFHQPVPDLARRPELGNLFEEIIVGVEEKAEARTKLVHVQAAPPRPLDIFNAVIDGES